MKYHQEDPIFMSVFYAKNEWHKLLKTILQLIKASPNDTVLNSLLVYFSTNRGENIRLTFTSSTIDPGFMEMEKHLCEYLTARPSSNCDTGLPLTCFFKNYLPNQIRYNLFNYHSLIPLELRSFQSILSRILLVYFKDQLITEEQIFLLIVTLHQRMLDALFNTYEEKASFSLTILDEISNEEFLNNGTLQSNWSWILPKNTIMQPPKTFVPDNLLQCFQDNVSWYSKQNLSPVEVYLIVLRVISLHFDKLPQQYFVDILQKSVGSVRDFSGNIF
jgi:hypothetical protein